MNTCQEKWMLCILYLANALVSSSDWAMGRWSLGLTSSKGQSCHPTNTHTQHVTWHVLMHDILKVGINHLYCAEEVILSKVFYGPVAW